MRHMNACFDNLCKIQSYQDPVPNCVEHQVVIFLHKIGMSANTLGYFYLKTGIILALSNEESLHMLTKQLYPEIARLHKTTASRVERAIRHIINSAWCKPERPAFFKVFNYTEGHKPTNGQFIGTVTEYLKIALDNMDLY